MHMRALTWPRTKKPGWLLPPPPAFNVTKPSCCFQHMSLGRRQREAGRRVELPKTPWEVKGRRTVRQRGARCCSADRLSPPSAQPVPPGGSSPSTHPPGLEPPAALQPAQPCSAMPGDGHISLLPSYPAERFRSLPFSAHLLPACVGDILPGSISFPVRRQSSKVRSHVVSKGSNKLRQIKDKKHSQIIIKTS